jgi:asparagine synthase (glutamine-hydrolysing)
MRLSRLVRDSGLKVVLTGEGADEVFGGYDQFKENKIRRFWARSPGSPWRRRLLDRLEGNVPRTNARTRAFWYAFYEQGLGETDRPGYSHYPRWRNGLSLLPLLADSDTASRNPREWIDEVEATVPSGFRQWDPLSQAQYWEIRQFLAGYLLSSQGDRVSMANAVEGRYPFLDSRVFELSRRMPPSLKLRVLREKDLLKRTFRPVLPAAIVDRAKYPYRAPDAMALVHGPNRHEVLESLGPEAVARRGLFRPAAVGRLLERVQRSEEPPARDNMALVLAYTAHAVQDQLIDGVLQPATLPPLTTRIDLRAAAPREGCA